MKKILLAFMMLVILTGCSTGETAVKLENNQTVGTGKTSFALSIVDDKGEQIDVTVKTDKEFLGEALLELHIIAGENGEYGFFVNSVNGVFVDSDKDGKYWALYIDGEYAQQGIDATEIKADSVYMLKVEEF